MLPLAFLADRGFLDFFLWWFWGRSRIASCSFQFTPAFRTLLLCQEAIASAFRTLPKVACDVCAAMWTGSCHCGDLATTFRTFDDAHVNKAQRDTGFLRPCPFASLLMKVKLTLLSSPLQREPRPLQLQGSPLRRELPPLLEPLLPSWPFWASSLRELLPVLQACPSQQ